MIMDERTEFADATAISGAIGTALIGDVVDLTTARDIGNGYPLYFVVQVSTAVDSAADGSSVEFQLVSDAQEAIATDGSATVHLSTGAVAEADLTAGRTFVYAFPVEGNVYERYVGVLAVRSGEAVTAGAINAFVTPDVSGWKAYPEAIS